MNNKNINLSDVTNTNLQIWLTLYLPTIFATGKGEVIDDLYLLALVSKINPYSPAKLKIQFLRF